MNQFCPNRAFGGATCSALKPQREQGRHPLKRQVKKLTRWFPAWIWSWRKRPLRLPPTGRLDLLPRRPYLPPSREVTESLRSGTCYPVLASTWRGARSFLEDKSGAQSPACRVTVYRSYGRTCSAPNFTSTNASS